MKGKALKGMVVVETVCTLPDGVKVALVKVGGFDDVKKLTKVMEVNGETFSYTGWSSDDFVAFFKTGGLVGKAVRS